jgi:hypothetical protein
LSIAVRRIAFEVIVTKWIQLLVAERALGPFLAIFIVGACGLYIAAIAVQHWHSYTFSRIYEQKTHDYTIDWGLATACVNGTCYDCTLSICLWNPSPTHIPLICFDDVQLFCCFGTDTIVRLHKL